MSDRLVAKTTAFPRLIAGITLINAAAFAPPLAFGLLAAIRTYAPYLPEILCIATLAPAVVATVIQIPLASVTLCLKRDPSSAIQGAFLGSIFGLLFGVGTIVLVAGGLPLLGSTTPLWLAVCAGAWPLAARFLCRRGANSDEPDHDRASPKRGYGVLVFAVAVAVTSTAVSMRFLSSAREDATGEDPPSSLGTEGASAKDSEGASTPYVHHASLSPQDVLLQLVGDWDVVIANQRGAGHGRAVAVMLPNEPWVLWRVYEGDELAGIQLTGYESTKNQYLHYAMIRGLLPVISRGTWNDSSNTFEWRATLPDGVEQVMRETIRPESIETHTAVYRDGEKLAGHETQLTTRGPSKHGSVDHPILQKYVGNWTYSSTTSGSKDQAVHGTGRMIAVRLASEPLVVYRDYKSPVGLKEVRLINARDGGSLRQVFAFTDTGDWMVELDGQWDAATSTASWRGKAPGGTLLTSEDFTKGAQFTTKIEFRGDDGEKVAEGTIVFRRAETSTGEN